MYTVLVDQNLKEDIQYQNNSFPFQICLDDYSALVDHTLNCHWHREFEFDLVLEGQVDFHLNGRQLSLKKGECLFINSDTLHMASQSPGVENALILVVVFGAELFAREYTKESFLKYFHFQTDGFKVDKCSPEGQNIVRLLKDISQIDTGEYGYEFLSLSLMSKIWYYTIKCLKGMFPMKQSQHIAHNVEIKKMLSYIHEHFCEQITIKNLMEQANISRSDCFYYFKKYAGVSPLAYINDYRLSRAEALLADPDYHITDICFACGFSNSSYFGKLFRRKYGLSPLAYRKYAVNTQ